MLLPKIKRAPLRVLYRTLTGDTAASSTANQEAVDERIQMVLELGDPDIIYDLRQLNEGRPGHYDAFWDVAAKFLEGKADGL